MIHVIASGFYSGADYVRGLNPPTLRRIKRWPSKKPDSENLNRASISVGAQNLVPLLIKSKINSPQPAVPVSAEFPA